MTAGTYTGTYSDEIRVQQTSATFTSTSVVDTSDLFGVYVGGASPATLTADGLIKDTRSYGIGAELGNTATMTNGGTIEITGAGKGVKSLFGGAFENGTHGMIQVGVGDIGIYWATGTVENDAGGSIVSGGIGVSTGRYATLSNAGYISAGYGAGVETGYHGALSNTGRIIASGSGAAAASLSAFGSLYNSGTVAWEGTAGAGVDVLNGVIDNVGLIETTGSDNVALSLDTGGTIVNSGTIAIYATIGAAHGVSLASHPLDGGTGDQFALVAAGNSLIDNTDSGVITGPSGMLVESTADILSAGKIDAQDVSGVGISLASGGTLTVTGQVTSAGTGVVVAGQATVTFKGSPILAGLFGVVENDNFFDEVHALQGASVFGYSAGVVMHNGLLVVGPSSIVKGGAGVRFNNENNTPSSQGDLHSDVSGFGVTLENAGTIEGTASSGAYAIRIAYDNGLVIDDPTGVFIGQVEGGGGTLELASVTAGDHGTLSGLGTQFTNFALVEVDAHADWTLAGASTLAGGGTLTNGGTLSDTGQLTVGDASAAAAVVDASGAVLDLSGDIGIGVGSAPGSSLTNAGTLAKTAGTGTSTIAPTVTDTGKITVASGVLQFTGMGNSVAGSIAGAGTIAIGGGSTTLNLGSHLTSLSNLAVTGGTLAVATPLTFAGALTETGGTISVGSGNAFTLTGTDTLAGAVGGAGTLALTGGATTLKAGASLSMGRLTLSGSATALDVSTSLGYGGTFVANGGTVSIAAGDTFTLTGTATLASTIGGAGTLAIAGGTTMLNAGSHLNTLSALTLSGGTLKVNTAQTISGSFQGTGGTVSIVTGDTFTLSGAASLASTVSGGGTLAVGGGTTSLNLGSHLTNLSNLKLTGGTLAVATPQTFAGTFVGNGGTLSIAAADTFTLTGTDTIASTIGGAGTLAIGGGTTTLNLGTHLTNLAALKLSNAGTLTVATPLTFAGALTEASGTTLALGANKFTLTGAGSTLSGAVTGTGTLALGSGVSLHLGGTVASSETVALTGSDRLLLDSPTGFGATIAGLDSTDGLDFIGFAPGTTTVGFVENAGHTAGVLTVKNGSTTITLTLKGNYASGTFSKGTDGHSGTLITYVPAGGANAFQPTHVPPVAALDPVFIGRGPALGAGGQGTVAPEHAGGAFLGISLATMFGGVPTSSGASTAPLEVFARDPIGRIAAGAGDLLAHSRTSLGPLGVAAYHSGNSS